MEMLTNFINVENLLYIIFGFAFAVYFSVHAVEALLNLRLAKKDRKVNEYFTAEDFNHVYMVNEWLHKMYITNYAMYISSPDMVENINNILLYDRITIALPSRYHSFLINCFEGDNKTVIEIENFNGIVHHSIIENGLNDEMNLIVNDYDYTYEYVFTALVNPYKSDKELLELNKELNNISKIDIKFNRENATE